MRVLVVGATGTIGREVVRALAARHEVVQASRSKAALTVDITRPDSIRAMLEVAGAVDAIVCTAGEARFAPLAKLQDEDFQFSLMSKLMGQVTLVRLGLHHIRDNGSITVTSGIRVNVVSPPWVSETLKALGRDPSGDRGAAEVATLYVKSLEGRDTGRTLEVGAG